MERFLSWYLKASTSGRRVKNVPMLGTRSLSLDWPWSPTFWWATEKREYFSGRSSWVIEIYFRRHIFPMEWTRFIHLSSVRNVSGLSWAAPWLNSKFKSFDLSWIVTDKKERKTIEKFELLTMIIYHVFHILHDFGISSMSLLCHLLYSMAPGLKNTSGLGMQHKRNGQ